jgi:predicted acetyltransferase
MNALELRRLSNEDEAAFLTAIGQWDDNSGFVFVRDFRQDMSFAEYVNLLKDHERGENLPPGYVPDTSLFGFINGNIVGRLAIRHTLNDFLLNVGGHIGYGVVPPYRRKGYAREMLRLALPIAKNLGISKVLVTCDDDNIGSIRTIETNGGTLENKVALGPGKPLKRRYWIAVENLGIVSKNSHV